MKKIVVLMALLLMGVTASANAANYWTVGTIDDFSYYNEFVFGTGPAIIENFNNAQINTPGLSIHGFGVDQGVFQLGYYQNVVDDATGSYTVFTYAYGMHGFGGWFDLANPGGPGSSIDVYVGTDFVVNIPNTFAGEFLGFFSDTPFSAVTFVDGGLPGQETYQVVDLSICPVPLPGSLLLLGSGILGLVGIGIRRKSA